VFVKRRTRKLRLYSTGGRDQLKCDGTRAETRFSLSAKRTSPYKSAGTSVQSSTGSRDVRISGSNAGYTMFRGSVKGTGYPLHSPVSPSLPLPFVTVYHHNSTGVYVSEWIWSIGGMKVTGKPRRTSETISREHFVHHKPHMHWSAIETGLPRCDWKPTLDRLFNDPAR